MKPIIVADVHITRAEFVTINWPIVLRKRWWLYALLIGCFVYLPWNSGLYDSGSLLYQATITLAILVASGLLFTYSIRRAIGKQYDSTPLLQQSVTYVFSVAGVEKTSPLQRMVLPWTSFRSITRLGRWYFLLTGPMRGEFLDPTRIQEPATEADLCALLEQQGLQFQ